MKRLIQILMMACPLIAFGQNYFEAGTSWTDRYTSNFNPTMTYTYYLSDEEDSGLTLYLEFNHSKQPSPIALVKTEGEKVYFRNHEREDGEWYLMYDFGLKPGESCTVYNPDIYPEDPFFEEEYKEEYIVDFKCEEIIASDPEFGGLTTMLMSQFDEESKVTRYGKWLKGIGDVRGLCNNIAYRLCSYSSCKLIEVKRGDEVIYDFYDRPTYDTYFRGDAKWKIEYLVSDIEYLAPPFKTVSLKQKAGSATPTETYMSIFYSLDLGLGDPVYDGESLGEVKTEGEKVLFKYPEQESDEWLLMYDFGLKPGEGCKVYCPYFSDSAIDRQYITTYRCKEILTDDPEYNGLTTMVMTTKSGAETKWIKGVGDIRGVIFNYDPDLVTGVETRLSEMTLEGSLVYKRSETSVAATSADDRLTVSAGGNVITIETSAPAGAVCDISGRTVASFRGADSPVRVTAPAKGIYIIKAGNAVRKTVVR